SDSKATGRRFPTTARVHASRRRCWKPLPSAPNCRPNFRLVSKLDASTKNAKRFAYSPRAGAQWLQIKKGGLSPPFLTSGFSGRASGRLVAALALEQLDHVAGRDRALAPQGGVATAVGHRGGVDAGLCRHLAQGTHGELVPAADGGERIPAVPPHDVLVGDLVDHRVGNPGHTLEQFLRCLGPGAVGVGVDALVGDIVLADGLVVCHAELVVDEAGEDVLAENLAG